MKTRVVDPASLPTIYGLGADPGEVLLDGQGRLVVASTVSTADGADATVGAKADAAATTDTGTFSLIALIKRGLQRLTTLVGLVTRVTLVDCAPDEVETFTYSDAGTSDERIATIAHSSAGLALSYTETFVYAGTAGAYRVSTITRS